MAEDPRVIIIGAGQAGLATSYELSKRDIGHVLLERGKLGQTWRRLWDSFCLVTPNWTVQLPGGAYDGADPDGFMPRDEIVAYLERYATSFRAPLREGIDVLALRPEPAGGFLLRTTAGDMRCSAVVVATGAYQLAYRPAGADSLPSDLLQLDAARYVNPSVLPEGKVLIVGSGQSGCQIAEELALAKREVFLACGRAPWAPRRIAGRDIFWWVLSSGFLDAPLSSLPTPTARLGGNAVATGRDGGHDLHLRTLHAQGVTLLGHFLGAEGGAARFAADLAATIAWSDERHGQFMDLIRKAALERGLPEPPISAPQPLACEAPERVDLAGFGAVIFAGGFRPDYSWIDVPGAFDDFGFPQHVDGESTIAPGLHFIGVHFLRKRKSSLLVGVGEDAAIVAQRVAARS